MLCDNTLSTHSLIMIPERCVTRITVRPPIIIFYLCARLAPYGKAQSFMSWNTREANFPVRISRFLSKKENLTVFGHEKAEAKNTIRTGTSSFFQTCKKKDYTP